MICTRHTQLCILTYLKSFKDKLYINLTLECDVVHYKIQSFCFKHSWQQLNANKEKTWVVIIHVCFPWLLTFRQSVSITMLSMVQYLLIFSQWSQILQDEPLLHAKCQGEEGK